MNRLMGEAAARRAEALKVRGTPEERPRGQDPENAAQLSRHRATQLEAALKSYRMVRIDLKLRRQALEDRLAEATTKLGLIGEVPEVLAPELSQDVLELLTLEWILRQVTAEEEKLAMMV